MHGISMTPASSCHGGCPTIAEHQEFTSSMQPPMQNSMQPYWILPNPGYKIEANLWNLDIPRSAREPGPLASFLLLLQKYSEKLHFESTCCRLWSQGRQTQIMDEQERVHSWISGVTEDLLRMKRVQPAWVHQIQNQGCPPAQQPAPGSQSQPASSSAASMVPVKPVPMIRNSSMASAPQNAPFPSMMGADPWAETKMKQQRK